SRVSEPAEHDTEIAGHRRRGEDRNAAHEQRTDDADRDRTHCRDKEADDGTRAVIKQAKQIDVIPQRAVADGGADQKHEDGPYPPFAGSVPVIASWTGP